MNSDPKTLKLTTDPITEKPTFNDTDHLAEIIAPLIGIDNFEDISFLCAGINATLHTLNSYTGPSQRFHIITETINALLMHIENYTVPQYGDYPNDQLAEWSVADMMTAIKKYASRHGNNSRPNQNAVDCLKIAHYALTAFAAYQHQVFTQANVYAEPNEDLN